MNRHELKASARQCMQDTSYSAKKITLVFLLGVVLLLLADWGGSTLAERMRAEGHYLSQTVASGARTYLLIFFVSLVCQLLLMLFFAGYCAFALRLSRRENYTLQTLFSVFPCWGRALLLYFMKALFLSLWSSIFAMPVSYLLSALYISGEIDMESVYALLTAYICLVMFMASYRYRTGWFVLLDHPELSARQSLNQAKAIVRAHRWQLFLLDLSFLPWLLLSILTCGILLIWKLPYMAATYVKAYEYMQEDYAERQQRLKDLMRQNGYSFPFQ